MRRILSLAAAAIASASLICAAETAKTTLKIEGLTCGGCVPTVNVQLKKTEGVVAYQVSFEKGEALVTYDPAKTTPAKIADSVTKTGYVAFVRGEAPAAPNAAAAKLTATASSPDRVTLFQVPLMCPAVKGLGCGGKARPYMAQLEQNPKVAEAWLNHPGTVLAVVW
jgi:mercuric ion binding protein